jgi:membrane-associated phospholipid phosphatase
VRREAAFIAAFIATRARTHWRIKAALTLALAVFFCVPYFALQRVPVFPARTLPVSGIDRAIGFEPRWVWIYQSVYLLLVLVPWMVTSREGLRRYAAGFAGLSTAAFLCFFFVPVIGPRPDGQVTNVMFRILASYDRPLNCFPSLHVGLAVYTMLAARWILDGTWRPTRNGLLFLGWFWTALIAYAAVATKQHYAIDIPAGALLASISHWSTRHIGQRSMAHAETPLGLCRTSVFDLVPDRNRAGSPGASTARRH